MPRQAGSCRSCRTLGRMNPHRVAEAKTLLGRWREREASAIARFPLYTRYLESIANEERLNAVHKFLRPLITELSGAPHALRFEFSVAVCECVPWRGRTAGSSPVPGIPHQLLQEVVVPTLVRQRTEVPDEPLSHLWLGLLPSRQYEPDLADPRALLDRALELNPTDQFTVECVVQQRLHSVWFSCHHLPHSLLGVESEVRTELQEIQRLGFVLSPDQRLEVERAVAYRVEQLNTFAASQAQAT